MTMTSEPTMTSIDYTFFTLLNGELSENASIQLTEMNVDSGDDENDAHKEYVCDLYKVIISGYVIAAMSILGSVGNFLSAYTVWPKRNVQATSFLIIALSAFDSMFLVHLFLNTVIEEFNDFYTHSDQSLWKRYIEEVLSYVLGPFGKLGHYSGPWTIMLITFHRYVAVCHPMMTKSWCSVRKARIQIVVIAVAMFLIQTPQWMEEKLVLENDGHKIDDEDTGLFDKDKFDIWYETFLYFFLNHVIPFPCLLWMTFRLLWSLKKAKKRREQLTKRESHDQDLTRTLVAVIVVYIVCQTPNPIRRLLRAQMTSNSQRRCGSFYYYYRPLASTVLAANSAINFPLYYLFGKRFRSDFKSRMAHMMGRQSTVAPDSSIYNTTGSLTMTTGTNLRDAKEEKTKKPLKTQIISI